jgi:hypothetical protein
VLRRDANLSRRRGYADGTLLNLKTQWRAYFLFCIHYAILPLPSSPDTMCLFAQFLSRSLKSIQSVRAYVSAVRTLHLYLSLPCTGFNDFILNLTMRGISRINPHTPNQKMPITPDILLKLFATLDLSSPLQLALWTSFLFGFYLCARKSNLVIPSPSKFDPTKHLCRADIVTTPTGINVLIKWSKTIQAGERFLVIPLLPIPHSPLCPVNAYCAML